MNKYFSMIKKSKLSLFKDEILFLLILLIFHFIWKAWEIYFHNQILGVDILNGFFLILAKSITEFTAFVLTYFLNINSAAVLYNNNTAIHYINTNSYLLLTLLCTGIKQIIFFTFLMFCYPGSIKNKLWFIPSGVLVIYIFRAIIFATLAWVFFYNVKLFEVLHYASKYVHWTSVFVIWVIWMRYFKENKPSTKKPA